MQMRHGIAHHLIVEFFWMTLFGNCLCDLGNILNQLFALVGVKVIQLNDMTPIDQNTIPNKIGIIDQFHPAR